VARAVEMAYAIRNAKVGLGHKREKERERESIGPVRGLVGGR
jgi:hypothetical protein